MTLGLITITSVILTRCGGSEQDDSTSENGQSMICKCLEESNKGSLWYQEHEYECIELSSTGQRCNE